MLNKNPSDKPHCLVFTAESILRMDHISQNLQWRWDAWTYRTKRFNFIIVVVLYITHDK